MNTDLSRFKDVFFEEADEHFEEMEAALLGLEATPDNAELVNATFRAVHSIKGSGGMFGFEDVVRFAHSFESLLDLMRNGDIAGAPELGELLLKASDVLRGVVASARTGEPLPEITEQVLEALDEYQQQALGTGPATGEATVDATGTATAGAGATERPVRIEFRPAADIFQTGMDPLLVLRDLSQAGNVTSAAVETDRIPPLAELDPEQCYLSWRIEMVTSQTEEEIRDVFAFVEDGAELRVTEIEANPEAPGQTGEKPPEPGAAASAPVEASTRSRPAPAHHESTTVRVATPKVDKLVDLVGELVIAQSVAGQILGNFSIGRLGELVEAFAELDRNTRELQERVMAIRMQPIGGVFSRFPRLVRDLSAATGKQIELEVKGEETELDKSVIERLGDPLTHLIRNAIDHGIESPEGRTEAGKPATGHVCLAAFHEGGNVIVEIADDGRGLDAAKIQARAVERGLIAAGSSLTEEEAQGLIFRPGFSTADQVSDISGRGVGMDVVRRNVEELNGSVSVRSAPGQGATFRVKLPLTLAILDGLLVKVAGEQYVLPLVSIVESVQPKAHEVVTLAGRGQVVNVRGEPLPLVRLHCLFGVSGAVEDPAAGAVVIFEHEGRRRALLVDELLGQQQVVIKSLETNYHKVDGTLGATILGDGRAALILDAAGLVALSERIPSEAPIYAGGGFCPGDPARGDSVEQEIVV